jgi:hypothetical protein
LGAAILHNPAENYQMFTSNDRLITDRRVMNGAIASEIDGKAALNRRGRATG